MPKETPHGWLVTPEDLKEERARGILASACMLGDGGAMVAGLLAGDPAATEAVAIATGLRAIGREVASC